jgi:hypothetical protein
MRRDRVRFGIKVCPRFFTWEAIVEYPLLSLLASNDYWIALMHL